MILKQGPIGDIHTSYIFDKERKKIVGTDKNKRIKEIDIPKGVY